MIYADNGSWFRKLMVEFVNLFSVLIGDEENYPFSLTGKISVHFQFGISRFWEVSLFDFYIQAIPFLLWAVGKAVIFSQANQLRKPLATQIWVYIPHQTTFWINLCCVFLSPDGPHLASEQFKTTLELLLPAAPCGDEQHPPYLLDAPHLFLNECNHFLQRHSFSERSLPFSWPVPLRPTFRIYCFHLSLLCAWR